MNTGRAGPVAEPVKLGLSTARTQYQEVTPWAAFREIPDNVLGMAGATGDNAVVAYIEDITSRKGIEAPVEGRMLVMATQTLFDLDKFKQHLSKVDPRAGGEATHANSVHGQGTSNASVGLGRPDLTGQTMIVRREARRADDPVRAHYPVKQSVIRFGDHANHQYEQQSGDTGRATLAGDMLVYPDKRQNAAVPYMASFAAYSDEPEPADVRSYTAEVLNTLSGATQTMLLDDTKWAVDPDDMPAPRDLCDGLITDVHKALKRLAEATGTPYDEVVSGDAVVYFFWNLRDEVCINEHGKLCVDGVPATVRMASSYLPHDSPTRALLSAKAVRMPDPARSTMVFQGDEVCVADHWVTEMVQEGALARVMHKPNGRGSARYVYQGEGFAVESYMQEASDLLNERRPSATVVMHMLGGLAIGEASGYVGGEVMLNAPKHRSCREWAQALDAYGKTNSLKEWLGKDDGRDDHQFTKAFKHLVPDTESGAWLPEEVARVRQGIKDLISMGQENAKLSKEEARDAAKSATAEYRAWDAANPDASHEENSEKNYELHCRAGGFALQTALKQIGYMLTGCGIVHLVTIFSDDIAVNKSKTSILNETPTTIRICETLPRLNVEIMLNRIKQLSDWRAADLAAAAAAAKAAADAAAAEKAEAEQREREAAKALRAAELRKNTKNTLHRMKQLGCAPKYLKGNTEVAFISNAVPGSGQKGELTAATMNRAHAERQLRAGTLVLPKGRAAGKALIFAGADPTAGHLYGHGKGASTEIVLNPDQPQAAPRPKPKARPRARAGPSAPVLDAVEVTDAEPIDAGVPVVHAVEAEAEAEDEPVDQGPELGSLTKWDTDNNFNTVYQVPLDSPGTFIDELSSNIHDNVLLAFTRAVASAPQLQKCFWLDDGGMPIELERDQRAVARIIPVVAHDTLDRDQIYKTTQTRLDDGCTRRVTIYMDVMRIASGIPNGLSKTLADNWLTHKLAHWAALVYVKDLGMRPTSELAKALVGRMLSGADDPVYTVDAHRAERLAKMQFTSTTLDGGLGKRKADDADAGRATRQRRDDAPVVDDI